MYENYREMSAEEKAQVKSIHLAIRADGVSRERNLAWAFVRGFKYRRCERTHHMTPMDVGTHYAAPAYADQPYVLIGDRWYYEHNMPDARTLSAQIAEYVPGYIAGDLSRPWTLTAHPDVVAWLKDPTGAIPVPVREPRKPYVEPAAAAQVA